MTADQTKGASADRGDELADLVEIGRALQAVFVPRDEFARHRRNVYTAIVIGSCVMLLQFLISVGVVLLAISNRTLLDEERAQTDAIEECTFPTEDAKDPHECFDDGQERQAEAIAQIGQMFEDQTDRIIEEIRAQQ